MNNETIILSKHASLGHIQIQEQQWLQGILRPLSYRQWHLWWRFSPSVCHGEQELYMLAIPLQHTCLVSSNDCLQSPITAWITCLHFRLPASVVATPQLGMTPCCLMCALQASLNCRPALSSPLLVRSRAEFAGLMYTSAWNSVEGKYYTYLPALSYASTGTSIMCLWVWII